jgi:hypothetical protein
MFVSEERVGVFGWSGLPWGLGGGALRALVWRGVWVLYPWYRAALVAVGVQRKGSQLGLEFGAVLVGWRDCTCRLLVRPWGWRGWDYCRLVVSGCGGMWEGAADLWLVFELRLLVGRAARFSGLVS